MPPKVSVIIPTYNRREMVQEAIDSVLAQTYTDYEIIVVDDGSTDGTGEALQERYGNRIRYVWQENQGESVARNRGIEMAEGEYVAFLDSDDLWWPDKLARQVILLDRFPTIGLVFCQAQGIDGDGKTLPGPPMGSEIGHLELVFENLCLYNFVSAGGSTVVMRKTVLDHLGGFDETIQFGEDWDLWLRAALVTDIEGIPEPLANVRLHQGGQWWFPKPETIERQLTDHLRLLERAFDKWSEKTDRANSLRAYVIAREYAQAAWAYYALGDITTAHKRLEFAFTFEIDGHKKISMFNEGIVSTALTLSQMYPEKPTIAQDYVETVLAHLPGSLFWLAQQRRCLIARVNVELGYSYYFSNSRRRARQYILKGIMANPKWLRNRGTVALLLKLYLGKTFFSIIHYFWDILSHYWTLDKT